MQIPPEYLLSMAELGSVFVAMPAVFGCVCKFIIPHIAGKVKIYKILTSKQIYTG